MVWPASHRLGRRHFEARTSHCGETARFLPLCFWRYTTPPSSSPYDWWWKYATATNLWMTLHYGCKVADEAIPWRYGLVSFVLPESWRFIQLELYLHWLTRSSISLQLLRRTPSNLSGVNYSQVTDGCFRWGFILRHIFPLDNSSFCWKEQCFGYM